MTKYYSILVFLLANKLTNAQQVIKGKVVDSQTQKVLPYVNIGILHKNIGTVSDKNGIFELNITDITDITPLDTLKISCIGYTPLVLPLSTSDGLYSIYQVKTFEIDSKAGSLPEIEIRTGKIKSRTIGNKIYSHLVVAGLSPLQLGAEFGTVLKYNKKNAGQIQNVNFHLSDSKYDSLMFRVNIYRFKNGHIEESILKEPLYIKTKNKSGVLSLNLEEKKIFIDGDSFLSLEWIENSNIFPENEKSWCKLWFIAGFLRGESYARATSQSDWQKMELGLGFWTTVKYKK